MNENSLQVFARVLARAGTAVLALAISIAVSTGCSTLYPYQEPFAAEPIEVDPADEIALDRLILLFDASGSIHSRREFPSEKAWVESFVQGMPEGDYQATIRSFGGERRHGPPLAPFDRDALASQAKSLEAIGETSPLDAVLLEIASELQGVDGRTAIVIVSDGMPDPPRNGSPPQPTLEAAQTLVEGQEGAVCYHTVLAGNDASGAALLQSIAELTPCGSHRASGGITDSSALASFERDVFLSRKAPVSTIAKTPVDPDGDGVFGAADECPATPPNAQVDARGCWVIRVTFASGSAELSDDASAEIEAAASILVENPDLRVEVAGFTDSSGSAAFNQKLSERRAESVRRALVESGIARGRLEARGYGEENPAADNETREGRARNRRIELIPLG